MTTVVVVGGGTTGAIACGMLCSSPVTKNWTIINVRSPKIPIIGVGESTTPFFMSAIQDMGIEKEFVEQTNAWPKYGAVFKGWSKENLVGGWAINGHRNDVLTYLEGLTEGQIVPRSSEYIHGGMYPYNDVDESFYAPITLHIDAKETSEFLFEKSDPQMDKVILGNVNQVVITEGTLNYIVVDGEVVEADYFIDATGFKRVLINEFKPKFIESKLPCNSALFINDEESEEFLGDIDWESRCEDMVTTATTGNAGWFWDIPLKVGRGQGYVYSSNFLTEEQAIKEFSEHLGKDFEDYENGILSYKPGWVDTPARGNCFAIGLAAGFLDALDSPSIAQTTTQIGQLLRIWKHPRPQTVAPIEKFTEKELAAIPYRYSKFVSGFYEKLNEYLSLHYRTCLRTEPFWNSIEKFTEDELIDRYKNIIDSEPSEWRGFGGFLLSQSSRVINNRIMFDQKVASSIYDTLSKEEQQSVTKKVKTVPFSRDIFMKHVKYGNANIVQVDRQSWPVQVDRK